MFTLPCARTARDNFAMPPSVDAGDTGRSSSTPGGEVAPSRATRVPSAPPISALVPDGANRGDEPSPDTFRPTVIPEVPAATRRVATPVAARVRASLPPAVRRSLDELRTSFHEMRASRTPLRTSLVSLDRWVRHSLDHVKTWVPRWKPWSPQRVLAVTFAFGAAMLLLVVVAPKPVRNLFFRVTGGEAAATRAETPTLVPGFDTADWADARMDRRGRSPISGSILTIPPSFASVDGAFDLVIHFHGNTDLVEDSFGVAGINAAVLIVNLGNGSGVYEDRFSGPDQLRAMLTRTRDELGKRGLTTPHLRRLALTAWSAGYGAVIRILENPALADEVDTVVLLDGIHAGHEGDPTAIDMARLAPFVRFAEKARDGQRLMLITHSDIEPTTYPGTRRTTDALLQALGVTRVDGGDAPAMPALSSNHGVPKSKLVALVPKSHADAGNFHVRGFAGELPESHMAHLIQMATVALPELSRRWGP